MNDTGFGWIFSPNATKKIVVSSREDFFESSNFFHTLLEFIQDGVSVLDKDLNVLYVNTTISSLYLQDGNAQNALHRKCYIIYHQRNTPCENCPTLQTIKDKQPHMSVVSYNRKDNRTGWHELFSIPVFNEEGDIILIIEYIRDITFQKFIRNNLAEIEQRFKALEKQNEMLIQILNQREKSQNDLEDTISTNVEKFIKPSLDYLKKTAGVKDIDLVNGIIDEIVYPITKKTAALYRQTDPAGTAGRHLHQRRLPVQGNRGPAVCHAKSSGLPPPQHPQKVKASPLGQPADLSGDTSLILFRYLSFFQRKVERHSKKAACSRFF